MKFALGFVSGITVAFVTQSFLVWEIRIPPEVGQQSLGPTNTPEHKVLPKQDTVKRPIKVKVAVKEPTLSDLLLLHGKPTETTP